MGGCYGKDAIRPWPGRTDHRDRKPSTERMNVHPNYKRPARRSGETPIEFAVRSVAHLISPPMVAGENHEIECTDLAKQVLDLIPTLEAAWWEDDELVAMEDDRGMRGFYDEDLEDLEEEEEEEEDHTPDGMWKELGF